MSQTIRALPRPGPTHTSRTFTSIVATPDPSEPFTSYRSMRRPSTASQSSASTVWHVDSVSSGVRCCSQKSNRVWMALYRQDQVPNVEAGTGGGARYFECLRARSIPRGFSRKELFKRSVWTYTGGWSTRAAFAYCFSHQNASYWRSENGIPAGFVLPRP